MSTGWPSRVFWKEVTVAPAGGEGDGWTVALDGRPLRTAARRRVTLATEALAEMVAREWRALEERIDPARLPATRLANAAIDRVSAERAAVIDHLAGYGASDLLCYRATHPAELVARQAAAWDPLLEWVAEAHGARLHVTSGVMPVRQPPEALAALRAPLEALDDFALAASHDLVTLSGSLVLGLAVLAGRLRPDEAWALSRIDEDWQQEQWGIDAEAARRTEHRRGEFMTAARILAALGIVSEE